jgi:hypothetical protein
MGIKSKIEKVVSDLIEFEIGESKYRKSVKQFAKQIDKKIKKRVKKKAVKVWKK